MDLKILKTAENELEKISNPLNMLFGKYLEKILIKEINKHLNNGLPFFVEKVTKQARIV